MTKLASRILVSVTGWDPGEWVERFARYAPEREVVTEPEGDPDPSIRYAVVWKQPAGILAKLPRLEAIFSMGAGVDHLFRDPELPDRPILRIVAADLTMRMSEYVVWQVLDHHRQGPAYREMQRQKKWLELPQPAASAVTIGIMGLGVLGLDAARKLQTLGFRVQGWSRKPKRKSQIPCLHGMHELPTFLGTSDMVAVLLPLTEATRGIIDAGMLAQLKKETPLGGPVLINAGRGGLQVEADLIDALESGRLMAASLDVFEHEPLSPASPLWIHPRVTVTPHAAASSDPDALVPEILAQMENFEKGRVVNGIVDRSAGY